LLISLIRANKWRCFFPKVWLWNAIEPIGWDIEIILQEDEEEYGVSRKKVGDEESYFLYKYIRRLQISVVWKDYEEIVAKARRVLIEEHHL
jgi:hypothetical protein